MLSRVTDLALEVRESFPNDNVEIAGVEIKKQDTGFLGITMTIVEIKDEHGKKVMGKPIGKYITLEFADRDWEKSDEENLETIFAEIIKEMITGKGKKVLIAGLGNRYATPDMLGNKVVEYIDIAAGRICAIAPGVLSQTGMETCDIIKNIVSENKFVESSDSESEFDCVIVIDSLCSSHTERLCHTIQITDTGISPGAGVGNKRKEINEEIMGVPVIAIGVPTVVSMATVAYDCIEETLLGQGFSREETETFLNNMSNEKYSGLFVTPKDIDEQIFFIGKAIAGGLNKVLQRL